MVLGTFADNDEALRAFFEEELPENIRARMALLLGEGDIEFFDMEKMGWINTFQALTSDRIVLAVRTQMNPSDPERWDVFARRLSEVLEVTAQETGIGLTFQERESGSRTSQIKATVPVGFTKEVPPRVVDIIFAAR